MKKTKVDIYACSKPLQYFNARNLPQTFHPDRKRILVIITFFYKADDFFENIKATDNHWDEVVKVSSELSFYIYLLFHRFDSLIYCYDTSTVIGLIHFIKKFDFYLLEEGMWTYLPSRLGGRKRTSQRILDKIIGVSEKSGHTKFVRGAYVYYPDLYKTIRRPNLEPMRFAKPFIDKIAEDCQLFINLSEKINSEQLHIKKSRILLYITSWDICPEIIEKMKKESCCYDYTIIKPHPHITNYNHIEESGIEIIKSNLMVEFLLAFWIAQDNKITVYHVGSAAVFYFRDVIKAIDLSPNYNSVCNKLIRGDM